MKHYRHTPAFTMLELVFVIAVVGIISALALPRFDRDNLQEAADQLASHIRYAQHLAMQDDRFMDPSLATPANWYKTRWQIAFHKRTQGSDYEWSYTIFSDTAGANTGNPDVSEMAKNPESPDKYLTGGYSTGTVAYKDADASPKLNLGHAYGIEYVGFGGGCTVADDRNQRLAFDYLGRPLYEKINNLDSPYMNGAANMLLLNTCTIDLCLDDPCPAGASDRKITIAVEPETGYTHIL